MFLVCGTLNFEGPPVSSNWNQLAVRCPSFRLLSVLAIAHRLNKEIKKVQVVFVEPFFSVNSSNGYLPYTGPCTRMVIRPHAREE